MYAMELLPAPPPIVLRLWDLEDLEVIVNLANLSNKCLRFLTWASMIKEYCH